MYKALIKPVSVFPDRGKCEERKKNLKIIKVFNCRAIFKVSYFHKMTAYVAIHNEAAYSYLIPGKR